MASIKEVARKASVSISTVSHVLNGTKFVSEDLVARVKQAVLELNYEVDPVARSMKVKKSNTIGVITVDMCGLFYPYVIKGIYEIANEKNYNVIICDSNGINQSKGSQEREFENIKKLVSSRVDGIIFASVVGSNSIKPYLKEIKKIANKNKKIPIVAIEQDFSEYGIDSVFSNSFENGKNATYHLIECGCKKIAHITGAIESGIGYERTSGYKFAIAENGLNVNYDNSISNGAYTHQSGYTAMKEILSKMPDVDGVFIANDQMSVGALKALSETGIRVPEDIKIIGYDNVFISSILEPTLSTVNIRKKEMGLEAMRILLDRIEQVDDSEYEVKAIEMKSNIVVRQTTSGEACIEKLLSDW